MPALVCGVRVLWRGAFLALEWALMSIDTIIAFSLLVVVAGGFYAGRTRAIRLVGDARRELHSLPNYYGYYVALWTGLPSLLLLLAYALIGGQVADRMVVSELTREAAPLTSTYRETLATDTDYQALTAAALQQRANVAELNEEISRLRSARGEDRDPAMIEARREEVLEVLNLATDTDAQAVRRQEEIAQAILDSISDDAGGYRVSAGFQLELGGNAAKQLFMADARRIADGRIASRTSPALNAAAASLVETETLIRRSVAGLVILLAIVGFGLSRFQIAPSFRARNNVERLILVVLFLSSLIAILTTVGIVASLLFESLRFFREVPLQEFLFGLQWSPQIAIRADQVGQSGAFGAVPLFAGTAMITLIAMIVAVPIGLFSAIYLSEYAGTRFRQIAKPLLEILAGIPTVVYGFFALLTVGPFIRGIFGALGFEDVVTQSALSAGLVMGVMIIPFISSLSDDVINSVPQTLRDGSYAMGATKSETIRQVVLPAALPGIVGAVLLAISRAIGETMIVVMAAGQGANLTANPLEAVTTITVQIVMLLTGDQEFDSVKTLSAFALGLVLFVLTLIMNIIALRVVRRYREKYD